MTQPSFPLLEEKLRKSYPHVVITVPTSELSSRGLLLCRYNIAKHRLPLNRFRESDENGYFVRGLTVPVANSARIARTMLQSRKDTWVEVLSPNEVPVGASTQVSFYSDLEREAGANVARALGFRGSLELRTSAYTPANPNPALAFVERVGRGEQDPLPIPEVPFD